MIHSTTADLLLLRLNSSLVRGKHRFRSSYYSHYNSKPFPYHLRWIHTSKDNSSEEKHRIKRIDDGWISQNTRNQIDAIYTQSKSIPNIITLTRIASTPMLSYLVIEEQYVYAMYGCILAGFSDLLDGYIARKYDMKTNLGTYLDPLGVSVVFSCMIRREPKSFDHNIKMSLIL
jgi:hypothetical protein